MIPREVLEQWELPRSQVRLGAGLINDTYCVDHQFVLQRINKRVFSYPERLVSNYMKVYQNVADLVPRLVPTIARKYWFEDSIGHFWKCSVYHPSRNFQTLPDDMVYAAGQAFGLFLQRLRDLDVQLEPVIPNFHDFGHCLDGLEKALSAEERQINRELLDRCRKIVREQAPTGPRQIIHGDCKINNLLFDLRINKVVRIVDIDTLMWGYPEWDFGDLVRSLATGFKQKDQFTRRMHSVCTGFFEQFSIDERDAKDFAYAPSFMSMMLGVRFLTDHALGDKYFKVERTGENMDRAIEQFEIARYFDGMKSELLQSICRSVGRSNSDI